MHYLFYQWSVLCLLGITMASELQAKPSQHKHQSSVKQQAAPYFPQIFIAVNENYQLLLKRMLRDKLRLEGMLDLNIKDKEQKIFFTSRRPKRP